MCVNNTLLVPCLLALIDRRPAPASAPAARIALLHRPEQLHVGTVPQGGQTAAAQGAARLRGDAVDHWVKEDSQRKPLTRVHQGQLSGGPFGDLSTSDPVSIVAFCAR